MSTKLSRGQKGEEIVSDVLNSIKEYHHLLNNVTFKNKRSEMTHQIDHILIHPHGIFVIETKNYYGEIIYDEVYKDWIRIIDGKRSRSPDPLKQNKSHAITLYKALRGEYKVIPVVVFVQNNAPYMPNDNAINLDDLLLFIDSYPYEHKYTNKTLDKIKAMIDKKISDVSMDEHLENIDIIKTYRKQQQAEIAYAIESHKCPRCGGPILQKGNIFKCYKCDFNFKL